MVSNTDTIYVNLRIDEDPSFVRSQSKTGASYQGFSMMRNNSRKMTLFFFFLSHLR